MNDTQSGAEQNQNRESPRPFRLRKFRTVLLLLLVLLFATGTAINLLQERISGAGVHTEAVQVPAEDVELLFDLTGVNSEGERVLDHRIFDRLLTMIDTAGDLIVLDMFLINHALAAEGAVIPRNISDELVEALVARKKAAPDTFVLFITDPINNTYSNACPSVLEPLVAAGGHVVVTDHHLLKDSNYLYSPFYRAIHPVGRYLPLLKARVLPNPLEPGTRRVSLGQFFQLLNFKANHRKVAITRNRDGRLQAMVTSWNPHSASSAHGNVATLLHSGPLTEILQSEYQIARSSILHRPAACHSLLQAPEVVRLLEKRLGVIESTSRQNIRTLAPEQEAIEVEYVTEDQIGDALDHMLDDAADGDTVQMMIFYLADPGVIRRLRQAALRGASVRLLLDPNKDAFGREKGGIPNRAVGTRLANWAGKHELDLQVRWFLTHGEQAHFKLLRVSNWSSGKDSILVGSANFTVRNLRGSNLEANVVLRNSGPLGKQTARTFDKLWHNKGGLTYSAAFDEFSLQQPHLTLGTVRAAFGTTTGMSTY